MTKRQREAVAAQKFDLLPPNIRRLIIEALRRQARGLPARDAFDLIFAGELPTGVQP